MTIGALGDVQFGISGDTVKTFRNLRITESASYSQHKPHGAKAIPEFVGYDAPQITFEITLSAFLGVNPKKEIDRLREMMRSKKGYALAIGTELIGDLWIISNVSRTLEYMFKDGTPTQYKVSVSLIGMEAA